MKINRVVVLLLLTSAFGFAKKKDLGVGLQFVSSTRGWGDGTLVAKKFISKTEAVDASLAIDFRSGFGLDVDYLIHDYKLFPVTAGKLPLIYGVGGFLGYNGSENLFLGVRMPVGVTYEFKTQFDVYAKMTPALRVFVDRIFEVQFAIGGRYWF